MTYALTYDEVKALKPCGDEFPRVVDALGGRDRWNGNRIDAKAARDAGCTLDDLLWVATELACRNADAERRLRLWTADCAAHVLHIYEKTEASDAPREAIIAARQYARGEIDDAAWAAALAPARAARAARDAAWAAAWDARDAERAAERAAAWDARDAEEQWQLDRLVARFSDPEPDDWPLPEVTK